MKNNFMINLTVKVNQSFDDLVIQFIKEEI